MKKSFLFFSCEEIIFYNEDISDSVYDRDYGEFRLVADPNIRCFTASHVAVMLTIGLPSVALYVAGVPLILLAVLIRFRHDIMKDKLEKVPLKVRLLVGFAFRGFEPDYFFWDVVRIVRKVALIGTTVFLNTLHDKIKVLSAIFVLAVSFSLHIRHFPFKNETVDFFEELTLTNEASYGSTRDGKSSR